VDPYVARHLATPRALEESAAADPWNVVGAAFNAYVASFPPPRVLVGFNSKRYDSRIVVFEHRRAGLTWPDDTFFVDVRDFASQYVTLDRPRTLGRYHERVVGTPIASAHTALADARALAAVVGAWPSAAVAADVVKYRETVDGVHKRCGLTVDPAGGDDNKENDGGGDDDAISATTDPPPPPPPP